MNDVVLYWDKAARMYKEKQEQSSYVAINKKIVQKRFSNLNNKKVLDMDVGMDIENIEFIFSECSRLLKGGGIFYYTIVHSAFYDGTWLKDKDGFAYAKFLDKYLSSYELTNEFWGTTAHFHRALSYYLNLASKNKFCLMNTEEPVIYDGITKNKEIPLFFVAEYRKID